MLYLTKSKTVILSIPVSPRITLTFREKDYWNRTSISAHFYSCHCAMLRMYPISLIQNNLLGPCASVCSGYHFRYLWCMEPVLVNEVANFACHVFYVASTYDVANYIYRWPKNVISDMALEANENTFSNISGWFDQQYYHIVAFFPFTIKKKNHLRSFWVQFMLVDRSISQYVFVANREWIRYAKLWNFCPLPILKMVDALTLFTPNLIFR